LPPEHQAFTAPPRFAGAALVAALLLYFAFCWAMGVGTAGPQFDEVVSFRAAAKLAWGAAAPPCNAESLLLANRCFPLMMATYVGATKDYLLLPVFAIAGVHLGLARMSAAVLAAIGIFGVWRFLLAFSGPRAAAAGALILAVNPSYIDMPLFDNGNIAVSLAFAGLLFVCAARRRISFWSSFVIGLIAGLGTWARLNFLWLVIAAAVAAVLVYRRRSLRSLPAIAAGFAAGVLPLLFYLASRANDLLSVVRQFSGAMPVSARLSYLAFILQEVLFAAGEHRGIWNGAPAPLWLTRTIATLAAAALLWSLFLLRGREVRALAITVAVLLAYFAWTDLPLAEHHLVILVLLVAPLVAASAADIARRHRLAAMAVVVAGAAYGAAAVRDDVIAARALHQTRGVGEWSSSSEALAAFVQRESALPVYDLDWGLQQPVWFLSRARVLPVDLWPRHAQTWPPLIREGGVFITWSTRYLHYPAATLAFRHALACVHADYALQTFSERDGREFARVYLIPPSAATAPALACPPQPDVTFLADPNPVTDVNRFGLGETTLVFSAAKAASIEIHIGAPDGQFLSRSYAPARGVNGVVNTGPWISDGMTFYLQDVDGGKQLSPANTLATVRVTVAHHR